MPAMLDDLQGIIAAAAIAGCAIGLLLTFAMHRILSNNKTTEMSKPTPLLTDLLDRVKKQLPTNERGNPITTELEELLGRSKPQVFEWVHYRTVTPNGEIALALLQWVTEKERAK